MRQEVKYKYVMLKLEQLDEVNRVKLFHALRINPDLLKQIEDTEIKISDEGNLQRSLSIERFLRRR
jgi:hypothetical protein